MAQSLSESVVGAVASASALDFHRDKTHRVSGAKAGADVYPVGRGCGAVCAVAEPFSEALADGGESARERQGGDDRVPASALKRRHSDSPVEFSANLPQARKPNDDERRREQAPASPCSASAGRISLLTPLSSLRKSRKCDFPAHPAPIASRIAATASFSATVFASESARRFTSTTPCRTLRRLTTARTGKPIRSASLNFTPADSARSS